MLGLIMPHTSINDFCSPLHSKKEKKDVDDCMMQSKSLKDHFKDQDHFQRELNREQVLVGSLDWYL